MSIRNRKLQVQKFKYNSENVNSNLSHEADLCTGEHIQRMLTNARRVSVAELWVSYRILVKSLKIMERFEPPRSDID